MRFIRIIFVLLKINNYLCVVFNLETEYFFNKISYEQKSRKKCMEGFHVDEPFGFCVDWRVCSVFAGLQTYHGCHPVCGVCVFDLCDIA